MVVRTGAADSRRAPLILERWQGASNRSGRDRLSRQASGEGGPVADTPAAIAQMAAGLTQSMLNEQPPDDGHRLNILSSTFTHIGIAVYRDGSGTVWLTQDFSN
jgi:hypothetical protein